MKIVQIRMPDESSEGGVHPVTHQPQVQQVWKDTFFDASKAGLAGARRRHLDSEYRLIEVIDDNSKESLTLNEALSSLKWWQERAERMEKQINRMHTDSFDVANKLKQAEECIAEHVRDKAELKIAYDKLFTHHSERGDKLREVQKAAVTAENNADDLKQQVVDHKAWISSQNEMLGKADELLRDISQTTAMVGWPSLLARIDEWRAFHKRERLFITENPLPTVNIDKGVWPPAGFPYSPEGVKETATVTNKHFTPSDNAPPFVQFVTANDYDNPDSIKPPFDDQEVIITPTPLAPTIIRIPSDFNGKVYCAEELIWPKMKLIGYATPWFVPTAFDDTRVVGDDRKSVWSLTLEQEAHIARDKQCDKTPSGVHEFDTNNGMLRLYEDGVLMACNCGLQAVVGEGTTYPNER